MTQGGESLSSEEERLTEYRTLVELVKRFSPSGHERAAVEYLVGQMQALGYTRAFIDEAGNAVGVMGGGRRQAVLLGHIDTVPGEIPVRVQPAGSKLSPDEPLLLYGRGAVDAKGPLAAFTDAAARLGAVSGWQIIVIGAVEEERDSLGARYIKEQYHPEFAIVGEPSGWDRVTLGYKGSAWAEITLRTVQAHTAHQAQSAPEAAFEAWRLIQEWCFAYNLGRQRAFEQVTPTLRAMASGEDGFESWASLRVGARLPLELSPDGWYSQLEQTLRSIQPVSVSIQRQGYAIPAYLGEKNTPLVRALLAGIREAGGEPGFVRKTGTADLNIVAPVWGCPAAAYGPGDSRLDHTPEEHIDLGEYARSVEVLTQALKRLCAGV